MRKLLIFPFLLALGLAGAKSVFGQGTYKIEPVGQFPADFPSALEGALQPQGARLADAQRAALCEIWWDKAVPAQTGGGSSDAVYSNLGVGTFVGVLHFPNGGSDFRGQKIKAGYYTLRYAHIPQDGNHMGVNPYPDFLLLSPVAADTEVDKVVPIQDLIKLSKLASGTPHPAVMSLVPASQGASFPSLVQDDEGRWVLQMQISESVGGSETKKVPLALIVVGQTAAT